MANVNLMGADTWILKTTLERLAATLEQLPTEEIVEILEDLYRPVLRPGEKMPDWAFELDLDRRLVAHLGEHARQVDEGRRRSVKKRRRKVHRRVHGRKSLRRDLWNLANTIESHHGRDVLDILGLKGNRPTRFLAILSQARLVRDILRSEGFEFTYVVEGRKPLDRFKLADEVDASIDAFLASSEKVEHAFAEANMALLGKRAGRRRAHFGARAVVERLRYLLLSDGREDLARELLFRMAKSRTRAKKQEADEGDETVSQEAAFEEAAFEEAAFEDAAFEEAAFEEASEAAAFAEDVGSAEEEALDADAFDEEEEALDDEEAALDDAEAALLDDEEAAPDGEVAAADDVDDEEAYWEDEEAAWDRK